MKNPNNIDDDLDEVVKYWEAHQVSSKDVGARHHSQRVALTNPGDSSESDEDGSGRDTEVNPRVARSFESDLQREPTFRARINRANPLLDLGITEACPSPWRMSKPWWPQRHRNA